MSRGPSWVHLCRGCNEPFAEDDQFFASKRSKKISIPNTEGHPFWHVACAMTRQEALR